MKSVTCLLCYEKLKAEELSAGLEAHPKCSKKLFGLKRAPIVDLTLSSIELLAHENINQRLSVTGVQKKMSVDLVNSRENQAGRLTLSVGDHFILKPPNAAYPEIVELEDLAMHLAESVGISVARHGLIRLKSGELTYLTRRFDRGPQKIKYAQEDLCQLSGLPTSEKYAGSYEKVGKAIKTWSANPGLDAVRFFELLVFSFIIGNSDMHLKNFSILINEDGEPNLSPAYDLLPTQLLTDDEEELALTVNAKKKKLKSADFKTLSKNLGISERAAENTIEHFLDREGVFQAWVEKSFLAPKTKKS